MTLLDHPTLCPDKFLTTLIKLNKETITKALKAEVGEIRNNAPLSVTKTTPFSGTSSTQEKEHSTSPNCNLYAMVITTPQRT
eukprot:9757510-Ditylum_brightwellii.AAC.1